LKRFLDVSTVFIIVLTFLLPAMITGCGKKGDPAPRQQLKLPTINSLRGEITSEGVMLNWTAPKQTKGKNTFKIFRSTAIPGEDCPGCPQKFILLTEKDEEALRVGMKESGQYGYLDRDIDRGRSYGYRIIWCISSGPCSPESNTAEIKIK